MVLYPSMLLVDLLLLAHHQVLCYCSLAKPDSRTKNNSVALGDSTVVELSSWTKMHAMAGHSAQSSV